MSSLHLDTWVETRIGRQPLMSQLTNPLDGRRLVVNFFDAEGRRRRSLNVDGEQRSSVELMAVARWLSDGDLKGWLEDQLAAANLRGRVTVKQSGNRQIILDVRLRGQ